MKTPPAAALVAVLLLTAAAHASAQTADSPPPPRITEDGASEVAELIVTARRPGSDPSKATTECLWANLPADQRELLARGGDAAVRALAKKDELPLSNPGLTDPAVVDALRACGGPEGERYVPYARTALLSFANENAAARAVAVRGIPEPRLVAAWESLAPRQRELLVNAGLAVYLEEELEDFEQEAWAVLALLRRVRPAGVWNPLGYRNGSLNQKVVAYYEAHSVRTVMERRF